MQVLGITNSVEQRLAERQKAGLRTEIMGRQGAAMKWMLAVMLVAGGMALAQDQPKPETPPAQSQQPIPDAPSATKPTPSPFRSECFP